MSSATPMAARSIAAWLHLKPKAAHRRSGSRLHSRPHHSPRGAGRQGAGALSRRPGAGGAGPASGGHFSSRTNQRFPRFTRCFSIRLKGMLRKLFGRQAPNPAGGKNRDGAARPQATLPRASIQRPPDDPDRVRVLFLCYGNSCRSPMAEGLAAQIRLRRHVR